jgi:hypothetical protein
MLAIFVIFIVGLMLLEVGDAITGHTDDQEQPLCPSIKPPRAILRDLRGADTALERLTDATNVALADLPSADEYRVLCDIGATVLVMRTALSDLLSRARSLWPNES